MRECLARHDEILRDGVDAHDGVHREDHRRRRARRVRHRRRRRRARRSTRSVALTAEPWDAIGRAAGAHGPAHRRGRAARRRLLRLGGEPRRAAHERRARRPDRRLAASPRSSCATRCADGVELVDLGEHRLRDLAAPSTCSRSRTPTCRASSRPCGRSTRSPATCRSQLTSFVGRDDEIGALADALGDARARHAHRRRRRRQDPPRAPGRGRGSRPTSPTARGSCELAAADDDELDGAGGRRRRSAASSGPGCRWSRASSSTCGRKPAARARQLRAPARRRRRPRRRGARARARTSRCSPPAARRSTSTASASSRGRVAAATRRRRSRMFERRVAARRRRGADARRGPTTQWRAIARDLPPARRHPARHRARRRARGGDVSPAEIAARLDERFRLLTGEAPRSRRTPPDAARHGRLVVPAARRRRAHRVRPARRSSPAPSTPRRPPRW